MRDFDLRALAAAAFLALGGLPSGAVADEGRFAAELSLYSQTGTLGVIATVPPDWEVGEMAGNLVFVQTPGDRRGLVVQIYRAMPIALRDSAFQDFWHQAEPIERSEGSFAGHPASFLRTARPGRAGILATLDPMSPFRHRGERIIVVLDQCVDHPERPIVILMGTSLNDPPLTANPVLTGFVAGLELTLPEALVPCDPELLDRLGTVASQLDRSVW